MFKTVLLKLMLDGERVSVDKWIELLASEGLAPKSGNWMFGRPIEQAFLVSDGPWREITSAGKQWARA